MTEIRVPEMGLVVLVGVTGSGKSHFARKHFTPTQVVSSDFCRGVVSDDENDQSASGDAFDLLHYIVAKRLRRGLLTVVDATNVQTKAWQALLRIAKDHDVMAVAIVLDVPESLAAERNATRPDRNLPPHVIPRQRRELRRGMRELTRAFRRYHVLTGADEIDAATIGYEKAWNDKRELTGPFDLVGDVHGCRAELEELLSSLGYEIERDAQGRAVGANHPGGRTAVFVGDLVDRGPDSPGVLRLVMGMMAAGDALCVSGNLAGEGHSWADERDHEWHMAVAGRLAEGDTSGLVQRTESVTVDLASPQSEAAVTEWWEKLTAAGGEGMVVKPLGPLPGDAKIQPGIKCRGPEYLRIIYGPDYLEPANLDRLRRRSLGRKRSLAMREHALGAEALARLAAGEPLWRVHQAVFDVLALESEPVDPRL
ncbi:AAA family ATPase [Actinomadura sp. BRA 177]|uniref:AAA family ATPase n=1 Tax=Actinomadura sp. BRA 177 TaxID=2745202 RepID=UPI0015952E72|nr:AAA family ATPase [Actinomadura sp. BRA 177]NVI89837.1 AAA family ATPase [Actinomadura sp. BRA 177]